MKNKSKERNEFMNDANESKFDTMSEEELNPILELLQGGDPDAIALKAGINKEQLFRMRDDLLAQAERKRTELTDLPSEKIGRNEPCPCGSGKKYKKCCGDIEPPKAEFRG